MNPDGSITSLVILKGKLFSSYKEFADQDNNESIHRTLVVETRHWLSDYPAVQKLFDEALQKHDQGVYRRNTLDDLRLALEKLVQQLLKNEKSLENQTSLIGKFVKIRGGSAECANMFEKLVDYFTKYQNTYVKHDDAVIVAEIEFMFELTGSFMKHFLRLSRAPI